MTIEQATPLGMWVPIATVMEQTGLTRDQVLDEVFCKLCYDYSGVNATIRRTKIVMPPTGPRKISKSDQPPDAEVSRLLADIFRVRQTKQ